MKSHTSTAMHGGIPIPGKELAILAGVSPQAVSQAARRGALAPARTPHGAIFLDHPSTWQWLSTHPISPSIPKEEVDRLLRPALNHRDPRRDENGEPLLDPLHPHAIAYMARIGGVYDLWALWAGDQRIDIEGDSLAAIKARALEIATSLDLVDDLVALVTVHDSGKCTGVMCGRGAFGRLLRRSRALDAKTERELATEDGKLPMYITAPGESGLTWLSPA